MKIIEKNELEKLFHNYLNLKVLEDGTVRFQRFSQCQQTQYVIDGDRKGKDFYSRSQAASNVVLDFITDSSVLGVNYKWQTATGHDDVIFDFYVDGVFSGCHRTEDRGEELFAFDIPSGEHQVTLFFPWQVIIDINSIILSTGASIKEIKKTKRILVLGDSISQGYVCRHPSLSYVGYITRQLNVECLNQAVGGYWFEKDSLDEELALWNPDIIISAYGTNDYFHREKEEFSIGVRDFLQKLYMILPNTPVLGIIPIPRFDELYLARQRTTDFRLEEAHSIIRESYNKYPTATILENDFFPRHPDFFAPDLIHPNDLGFQIYGEAVKNRILQILD